MRKPGLHESLHDSVLLLVKRLIQLAHLLELEAMGQNNSRIELSALDLLQEVLPVLLYGGLTPATERDAFLLQRVSNFNHTDKQNDTYHQGTDQELITRGRIIRYQTDITKLLRCPESLIHNLSAIRLQPHRPLHTVQNSLRVAKRRRVNRAVHSARLQPVDLRHDVGRSLEIDDVAAPTLDDSETVLDVVNHDYAAGFGKQRPLGSKETNRAAAPDGNGLAFAHFRADGGVVGRGDDVGQVECLLVRHRVRDLKQIVVAERGAHVLCLSAGEAASEVGVAEDAGEGLAV